MSDFVGRECAIDVWKPLMAHFDYFKTTTHAGEPTLDFTLPSPDGEEVTLPKLRGKPIMIEFGSIT
jgi:cytochrome oxidase Cu insertion factor (SCO1/SenC/PrrC family)